MLLIISLLITIACLAIAAWTVVSGQASSMDGLLLFATCLVLVLIFGVTAKGFLPKRKSTSPPGGQRGKGDNPEQG